MESRPNKPHTEKQQVRGCPEAVPIQPPKAPPKGREAVRLQGWRRAKKLRRADGPRRNCSAAPRPLPANHKTSFSKKLLSTCLFSWLVIEQQAYGDKLKTELFGQVFYRGRHTKKISSDLCARRLGTSSLNNHHQTYPKEAEKKLQKL